MSYSWELECWEEQKELKKGQPSTKPKSVPITADTPSFVLKLSKSYENKLNKVPSEWIEIEVFQSAILWHWKQTWFGPKSSKMNFSRIDVFLVQNVSKVCLNLQTKSCTLFRIDLYCEQPSAPIRLHPNTSSQS